MPPNSPKSAFGYATETMADRLLTNKTKSQRQELRLKTIFQNPH